jgi:hypothetical protein
MGLFQSIIAKYKDSRQRAANKDELKQALLEAVSDGVLTKEEIAELATLQTGLDLSESDIKSIRAEVYLAAFQAVRDDNVVTADEEQELRSIQRYLGLSDVDISHTTKELSKLRLMTEIQRGNMPQISVSNLVLQRGEVAYWSEPAILAEEKVIRRTYQGESQGVSFRIMKGVNYRVGATRGQMVSETGWVPVSDGELVITNKRVIFKGAGKSFAIKLDQILDFQLAKNGVIISENNKSRQRTLLFKSDSNYEMIGMIVSSAINHYQI